MKTKRVSLWMQTVMAGAIVFGSSTYVVAEQNSAPRASPPTTKLMEQHWQSVIKERDTARRQVLIEEHRRMMNEARKTDKDRTTPTRSSEMSTMMQDSMHRDLRNTVEMHSIMLDMMK